MDSIEIFIHLHIVRLVTLPRGRTYKHSKFLVDQLGLTKKPDY